MKFTSPLEILPKFLWNDIYAYIDLPHHLKLLLANPHFIAIRSEQYYKDMFLNHRKKNIGVVRADSNMNYFWLYALITFNGFDALSDINITSIKISSVIVEPVTFMIFIKEGRYTITKFKFGNLGYFNYGVKLIGSKTGSSIITGCPNVNLDVSIPVYFSMSYITFVDTKCNINVNTIESNSSFVETCCHFRERFTIEKGPSILISKCVFINDVSNNSALYLHHIYNAHIVDCTFINCIIRIGLITTPQEIPKYFLQNESDYVPSDKQCDIVIDNNILNSTDIRIDAESIDKIIVSIRDNCIINGSSITSDICNNIVTAGNTITDATNNTLDYDYKLTF